jgi:hypothetical protein
MISNLFSPLKDRLPCSLALTLIHRLHIPLLIFPFFSPSLLYIGRHARTDTCTQKETDIKIAMESGIRVSLARCFSKRREHECKGPERERERESKDAGC